MYKFGFIGTGNMGGAIATAVCKKIDAETVVLADKSVEKATALSAKLGCVCGDNTVVAQESEYIVLGVKPQMMAETLNSIKNILSTRNDRFVIVTMAAGLDISFYKEVLGTEYPIIRIMPNMPVAVGEGMTVYCTSEGVTEAEKKEFEDAMALSGKIQELPEKLINAASAVSGSGPAFAFMFIESLADSAVKCGLPRDVATLLAAQTVTGSGAMVLESDRHPGELKDAVCSPGGTTIEGVHALEQAGFRGAVMNAVEETFIKNFSLGK